MIGCKSIHSHVYSSVIAWTQYSCYTRHLRLQKDIIQQMLIKIPAMFRGSLCFVCCRLSMKPDRCLLNGFSWIFVNAHRHNAKVHEKNKEKTCAHDMLVSNVVHLIPVTSGQTIKTIMIHKLKIAAIFCNRKLQIQKDI